MTSTNDMKKVEVVTLREYFSLLCYSIASKNLFFFFYLNNQGINLARRNASMNCGYASTN